MTTYMKSGYDSMAPGSENPHTGEENITFVTEPVANVEDMPVRSGSWKGCPIEIIGVTITALDPSYSSLVVKLENAAFRNDGFVDSEAAFTEVSADAVTKALRQLKDQYS